MEETPRFNHNWPDDPNGPYGLYYPDDLDERTPNPLVGPQDVFDISGTTYTCKKIDDIMVDNRAARFTQFGKLPAELRRMVWQYSLPCQRIVEVFFGINNGVFRSPCPIPVALYTSQEARTVSLEVYQPCFGSKSHRTLFQIPWNIVLTHVLYSTQGTGTSLLRYGSRHNLLRSW